MSKKKGPAIDCRSYEDLISQWIFEGDLDEKTLAPVKGHIKTCDACRSLKEEYEAVAPSLTEDSDIVAPIALKTDVMSQINSGSTSRRGLPFRLIAIELAVAIGEFAAIHLP